MDNGLSNRLIELKFSFAVLLRPTFYCFMFMMLLKFQEIVGNLVTHIGSGYPSEIESSLDILTELITEQKKLMAPFAVFIKVLFHLFYFIYSLTAIYYFKFLSIYYSSFKEYVSAGYLFILVCLSFSDLVFSKMQRLKIFISAMSCVV